MGFVQKLTKSGHTSGSMRTEARSGTVSIMVMYRPNGTGPPKVRPLGQGLPPGKLRDLLLIRKFVHRMKGRKRHIINGQIFEKAAILGPCADAASLPTHIIPHTRNISLIRGKGVYESWTAIYTTNREIDLYSSGPWTAGEGASFNGAEVVRTTA